MYNASLTRHRIGSNKINLRRLKEVSEEVTVGLYLEEHTEFYLEKSGGRYSQWRKLPELK